MAWRLASRMVPALWMVTAIVLASDADTQRRDFQTIASQLDPGGECFMVLSASRWLDRILKGQSQEAKAMPPADHMAQQADDRVERLRRFLNVQGISAFRGMGLSTVARSGGQHAFKCFLLRDTVDSNLPFWRGGFGWQPRRLMSLDLVPAGFSMVRAGTMEPMTLWTLLADGVREWDAPDETQRFESLCNRLREWLGIPAEDLFESLRDEALLAVRFDAGSATVVPVGRDKAQGLEMPAPSLLVVVATGEDLLRGVVERRLARSGVELVETEAAEVRIRHARDPVMLGPLAVQPAYASIPGFFVFGSSPTVVTDALLAYRHRNGWVTRPVFKTAFLDVPMVNNGLLYVDETAARAWLHWREGLHDLHGREIQPASGAGRVLAAMDLFGDALPTCALVVQNWRHGVMIMGRTGVGGEALLRYAGGRILTLWARWWSRMAVHPAEGQEG